MIKFITSKEEDKIVPNTLFVIPSYQRGYRWREEDVDKLLQDLATFPGKKYCLQPLELLRVAAPKMLKSSKNYDSYILVVDGQQRLTTISIIANQLAIPLDWDIYYLTEGKFLSELLPDDCKRQTINAHFRDGVATSVYNFKEKNAISPYFNAEKDIVFPTHFMADEKIDTEEDEQYLGQDAFNRLNAGKTPLTSSELIRALYMVNDSGLDDQQRIEISKEWELMEETLKNEAFWLMFNAAGLEKTPTRIDLLFALVLETNLKDAKNDPRIIYDTLENGYYNKTLDLLKVWREVLRCFWWMQSCYEDIETYNYLGWIAMCTGYEASTIYKDFLKYSSSDAFKQALVKRILNTGICDIQKYYGEPRLKHLLLLCNVLACNNTKERLRFDKLDSYDIEHIDSLTPNDLSKEKDRNEWLESVLAEYPQLCEGKTMDDFSSKDSLKELIRRVGEINGENAVEEKDKDGLGNLVLLNSSINRSYKNAVFPAKRKDIRDELENGTQYILPCTGKAFMKYYTTNASQITCWLQQDFEDYQRAMENLLKKFAETNVTLGEPCLDKPNLAPDEPGDNARTSKGLENNSSSEEENNARPLSGEVTFDKMMDTYKIRIPKIQRLYVQGRLDANGRKCLASFASTLVKSVCTGQECPLDMIYGIAKSNVFYPLDGQQRLTTLLLLSWLCEKTKANWTFDYETRRTTEVFIQHLLHTDPPALQKPNGYNEEKIKHKKTLGYLPLCTEYLEKQPWFMPVWKQNPGIAGMLEMLDSLYDKLLNAIPASGETSLVRITFNINYLDVSEKSYDHIFLKMNSRGRQLTTWENVKAVLDKYVPEDKKAWKELVDLDWPEIIWTSVNHDINRLDGSMQAITGYALKYAGYNEKTEDTFELDNWLEKEKNVASRDFFECAETLFSATKITSDDIKKAMRPLWKSAPLIPNFENIDPMLRKTLAAYYAAKKSTNSDWMRVVWNIVENSNVDGNLPGALKLIDELAKHSSDILAFLASGEAVTSEFAKGQLNEERQKAKLILDEQGQKNKVWYDSIKEAEAYPYLKGSISALFQDDDCHGLKAEELSPRYRFLKSLIDDSDPYKLIKVLVSNLPNDFSINTKIPLKKSENNWKQIIVKHFKEAFRATKKNEINTADKELWIHLLASTKLLKNSREDGKILKVYYGKKVLYGTQGCTWKAYQNVILDNHHYLPGLAKLLNAQEITGCSPIPDTDIFPGWDVNFKRMKESYRITSDGTLQKWDDKNWKKVINVPVITKDTTTEDLRRYLDIGKVE